MQFCGKNTMSKEEKRQQMLMLVEQWHQSGMSQQAFAREHHINVFTLRYWIKKKQQQQNEKYESSGFVQLNNLIGSEGVILRYPNGVELQLPLHAPVSMIKSLING